MTKIFQQDILQWCKEYKGERFHALLCDPPYHLSGGFMGKKWDKDGPDAIAFNPKTWEALAEHLLPGAFGMAFASSRGWHRLTCAIEDAGLIIHPSIFAWSFGSGFPKAMRIDNQIDKRDGGKRDVSETRTNGVAKSGISTKRPTKNEGIWVKEYEATKPATALASAWVSHRYGLQALKPALEPIIVFQKPYSGKPLESITKNGAGALNIDGARISIQYSEREMLDNRSGGNENRKSIYRDGLGNRPLGEMFKSHSNGRWPANFVLVHSPECKYVGEKNVKGSYLNHTIKGVNKFFKGKNQQHRIGYADANGKETIAAWECVPECPVRRLGEQSVENGIHSAGVSKAYGGHNTIATNTKLKNTNGGIGFGDFNGARFGDTGTASRFFFNADWNAEVEERLFEVDPVRYQAKASRSERDAGLDEMPKKFTATMNDGIGAREHNPSHASTWVHNHHPTVKPIKLTEWLATLLLPPSAYAPRRILIPFSGSGSEMIGAHKGGWEEIIGIEQEAEYVALAEARIAHHCKGEMETADLFAESETEF